MYLASHKNLAKLLKVSPDLIEPLYQQIVSDPETLHFAQTGKLDYTTIPDGNPKIFIQTASHLIGVVTENSTEWIKAANMEVAAILLTMLHEATEAKARM